MKRNYFFSTIVKHFKKNIINDYSSYEKAFFIIGLQVLRDEVFSVAREIFLDLLSKYYLLETAISYDIIISSCLFLAGIVSKWFKVKNRK